jgi:hypothetical protein
MSRFNYILMLVVLPFSVYAQQQVRQFHDEFGLQGEIKYFDKWLETPLPKQGLFELKWRNLDTNQITTYYIKGYLKNHLPYGVWQWEEGSWTYAIEPGVNVQPFFNATGERISWRGEFVNGVPNGKWRLEVDSVQLNQKNKPFVIAQFNYVKGVHTGDFSIERIDNHSGFLLKGTTDAKGMATGSWLLNYQDVKNGLPIIEERSYKNGLLIELKTTKDDKVKTVVMLENKEALKQLQDKQAKLIALSSNNYFFDGYSSLGSRIIENGMKEFAVCGWELNSFDYYGARIAPHFKRIIYPLQTHEVNELEALCNQVDALKNSLSEYRNNPSLVINRSRNQTFDLAVSYVHAACEQLNLMDSLIDVIEQPDFVYYNRYTSNYSGLKERLLKLQRVKANHSAIQDTLPTTWLQHPDSPMIKPLLELTDQLKLKIREHLLIISREIEAMHREGELLSLEKDLYRQYNQLDSVLTVSSGTLREVYSYWVGSYAKQQIQAYAQLSEYDQAKKMALDTRLKMDSLQSWVDKVRFIDSISPRINSQYYHLAYNPYTGKNDLEVRLKKRYYTTVTTVLLPELRQRLIEANDWESWVELLDLNYEVYRDIMDFVTKDDKSARKIEKRMRKMDNPDRMIKLMRSYYEETVINK